MILRYTLLWIPGVVIAIVNAVIREEVYGPLMSELRAHQVSTFTGIVLFGCYLWLLGLKWPIESPRQAITIGLIWLALTVAFEFLFGHYVMGHPWSRLLHDYNLLQGRLWALFLIWITVAPYVIYRLRAR